MAFLCGGAKPACPAYGTITGTLTAADVSVLPIGNADLVIPQGIAPGDFAGVLEAIQSGNSYVRRVLRMSIATQAAPPRESTSPSEAVRSSLKSPTTARVSTPRTTAKIRSRSVSALVGCANESRNSVGAWKFPVAFSGSPSRRWCLSRQPWVIRAPTLHPIDASPQGQVAFASRGLLELPLGQPIDEENLAKSSRRRL